MVAFPTYGTRAENYLREIKEAQSLGIDGFALNVARWKDAPVEYKERVANIFIAAAKAEPRFELFFSADLCCGLAADDVRDMLVQYSTHPSYVKRDGRPVLTTFLGQDQGRHFWTTDVLAPLRAKGIDVFFIPFFYASPPCSYEDSGCAQYNTPKPQALRAAYDGWWKDVIDGLHYFAVAGETKSIVATGEAYARLLRSENKFFVAGVSPYFWLGRTLGQGRSPIRRYFETHGGEGIEEQWLSVIHEQNPDWVIIDTYNDFTESYMSPADPAEMPLKESFFNVGPLLKSHAGYADIFKYYIAWFKLGTRPRIDRNALFVFYRTHPKGAVATNDRRNIVQYGGVEDNLYITTMARSPGMLVVRSGDRIETRSVAAGMSHFRIPFQPGPQTFSLHLGEDALELAGDPIDSTIETYNFTTTARSVHGR